MRQPNNDDDFALAFVQLQAVPGHCRRRKRWTLVSQAMYDRGCVVGVVALNIENAEDEFYMVDDKWVSRVQCVRGQSRTWHLFLIILPFYTI